MYNVHCCGAEHEFSSLDEAMQYAKQLGMFVTIRGGEFEIVGKFGVDTIVEGRCPDGVEYSWMKRRST